MTSRLRSCYVFLLLALLPSLSALPPQPLPAAAQPHGATAGAPASSAMAPADRPIGVLIELWDTPALATWASIRRSQTLATATQAARSQAQSIESAQQRLLPQIAQAGGQVLYRLQRTLNGIAAYVPPERIAELRRLPGVRAVRAIIPKALDNTASVPLIGAPQLWSANIPARGDGIRVGVIDSGIDYLHTDFGGSGRTADYARNNTRVITDQVGFPNIKVAGGYDFAGDAYNAGDLNNFLPDPDPDPMDCNGHGSHVAGALAGYGVNANGTTYQGPWNTTSVPTATMRIGPGVAPQAKLYALRIFGCAGTTALVPAALEWATDPNSDFDFSDHLDVVNLSLGSPFGAGGQDPDVDAANSAALAGMIVVVAAGNEGDTFYASGDPATADWAISVASSLDSTAITGAFRVSAPAVVSGIYAAEEAQFGPDLAKTGALTGTLRYPNGSAAQREGCVPFTAANAALLKGQIALIDRGTCSFKTKVRNAQAAGALGALIANNVAGYPPSMGDDPTITAAIMIPAMITTQATGTALKARLDEPGGVRVTLTAAYRRTRKNVDATLVDAIATSSARGPRRGDSVLKPDIAAPGDTIFSAEHGTGSQGISQSGTSAAAPHVSGAMALLRQLHPAWSVEELKALLMNTASARIRTNGQSGALLSPTRQGAGRIDLVAAAAATTVAYNADNPGQVSISFGAPQVVGTTTLAKNIRVVNKGAATATYSIGVTEIVTSTGVTISPLVQSISVPPFGSTTFAVLMSANAAQLDHTIDPATASTQGGSARHFLNEHSGYITLTGPDTLHVPFYTAPRPASDMRAEGGLNFGSNATSATLRLRGTHVDSAAYRSKVWVLELHEHNPDTWNSVGLQNAGDLRYIGVGSNIAPGAPLTKDTLIYFGIAAYGPWATPGRGDMRFSVYIDADRDGQIDFRVDTWNQAQAGGAIDPDDVFVAATINFRTGVVIGTQPLNGRPATSSSAPYDATALVLPVAAGNLGLTPGKSRFDYFVLAFQRDNPGEIDGSAMHSFDPAAPALSVGGIPLIDDLNGASTQVRLNKASWLQNRTQGLLLLHELNAAPYQAEVVPVTVAFRQIFLPALNR